MSMAEQVRDAGGHALVVIDDLSKHAATHREIALLTRQPPGREAYPGDVFHLHARLLERAAKLAPERGGGSLTALPIAETDAGNLSAYIPTNLISITDGQLVLDARLFHADQKPAIDVGTSVSRVGGKTQAPGLRALTASFRVEYAQFLELELFTRFGGMNDARVKAQLARGERLRALLAQPQYAPLRLVDEMALGVRAARGAVGHGIGPRDRRAACGVAGLDRCACRRRGGGSRARPRAERCQRRTSARGARRSCRAASAMTDRLADIGRRIQGVQQLASVVGAMRAIAATRAQQSRAPARRHSRLLRHHCPGDRAGAAICCQRIARRPGRAGTAAG